MQMSIAYMSYSMPLVLACDTHIFSREWEGVGRDKGSGLCSAALSILSFARISIHGYISENANISFTFMALRVRKQIA